MTIPAPPNPPPTRCICESCGLLPESGKHRPMCEWSATITMVLTASGPIVAVLCSMWSNQ